MTCESSASSTCSQELAASPSALSEPADLKPSHSAKSSRTAEKSSPSTGQASSNTTTLEPSQPTLWPETELPLMSSAAGSRAKTFPSLGSGLASRVRDLVCGVSTGDLLASYDPASSSLKTCQASLVSDLETFSETLPRSGMMRAGNVFQRVPLALPTDGTDGGLLATPTRAANQLAPSMMKHPGCRAWFPTPIKSDSRGSSGVMKPGKQMQLADAVRMWPTPIKRDCRSIKGARRGGSMVGSEGLVQTVAQAQNATTGALNPTWVEALMGFPLGWTDVSDEE